MESISYAIASADTVRNFVHAEVKATDNKISNGKEASESKAAKAKVR
jgi:flavin-binding protein dodecin